MRRVEATSTRARGVAGEAVGCAASRGAAGPRLVPGWEVDRVRPLRRPLGPAWRDPQRHPTLLIGPLGHAYELVIDSDDWHEELRSCLQAVIDGRYRERTEQGHISRRVVTMTFEQPGGPDVVVKHFTLDGDDKPMGERRFASYCG